MLQITITGLRQTIFISFLRTSDCRNKKWYGKKNRTSIPWKNIALNTKKNTVFTAERYFYRCGRDQQVCHERTNFRMAKKETKQKEKRKFPNSVMKDVNPFRQNNNNNKICSSPNRIAI
ncbi:hypothetical protein TNCV_2606111 [Trichonephila clavipes]|nr:hypothetical protein TNCV_2606111 [Trichonephila clavipes]